MLHLFHPALVHFSIALLALGGSVEAVGLLARREGPTRFGGALVVLGTLSLVPTVVSGFLAADTVSPDGPVATALLARHERNGLILLGWFGGMLFWKGWHRGRLPGGQGRLYALLLLTGVTLVAYGAWLGGLLVYRHGVGVG